MPPKRKAASASSKTNAKRSKQEQQQKDSVKKIVTDLKQVDEEIKHEVDKHYTPSQDVPRMVVYKDFNCMLNQTNIDFNNNKFYLIQLVHPNDQSNEFYVWTRWGRVGEVGQSKRFGPFPEVKAAISTFEKKFTDKTKNAWSKRDNFVFHPGKYSLVEVVHVDPVDLPVAPVDKQKKTAPSKLEPHTYSLVRRILDPEMFTHVMSTLNIDVRKMPLGKLSARQIASAFEVLDELEDVLQGKKKGDVNFLSSRFYTLMPHNFQRNRPPPINTMEMLREKFDMLNVLSDVALAQKMQEDMPKVEEEVQLPPDPFDEKYDLLECDIQWLEETDPERRMLAEFFNNTKSVRGNLVNIWKLKRKGESERIKPHAKTSNHKLLWHGTSVGVVAAILKTGLRIMPHSGGLVGKGIYFASQAEKSMGYCRGDQTGHCLMFIAEVVLGREHHIFQSDCSITKPPDGFDSVVAMGAVDSEPSGGKSLTLDGVQVVVPYSKPVQRSIQTGFHHSEYLIYNESQSCLRYLTEWKY